MQPESDSIKMLTDRLETLGSVLEKHLADDSEIMRIQECEEKGIQNRQSIEKLEASVQQHEARLDHHAMGLPCSDLRKENDMPLHPPRRRPDDVQAGSPG